MPNWVYNQLLVTGDKADIDKFRKSAKGRNTDLSLNALYPMPEELDNTESPPKKRNHELIRKYGDDNWYDWRVKNWGSKWDIEAKLGCEDKTALEYAFDSAWTAPIAWLKKISKDFPGLNFCLKYEEEGFGFVGKATVHNGKVENKSIK